MQGWQKLAPSLIIVISAPGMYEPPHDAWRLSASPTPISMQRCYSIGTPFVSSTVPATRAYRVYTVQCTWYPESYGAWKL